MYTKPPHCPSGDLYLKELFLIIKLTNGGEAIIDDDQSHLLMYKWQKIINSKTYYVTRYTKERSIYLHRQIMGVIDRKTTQVDHINGNGLDNRKCNLRCCTTSENHANTFHVYGTTSKYKGVHWDNQKKKWCAKVHKTVNGKKRKFYLGFYKDEKEAALAYDKGAKQIFGDFARTNFGAVNINQRNK